MRKIDREVAGKAPEERDEFVTYASSSQAQRLVADLGVVLQGKLARFAHGLVVDGQARELSFEDLLTPSLLDEHVDLYNREYGETDRRAIFSIWTLRHFQAVLPPLLSANIFLDCSPVLDLDRLSFVLSADLTVRRLKIQPDLLDLRGVSGTARFAGLVQSFMRPLIKRISLRAGVTERVLWSNAGTTLEGFLGIIESDARGRHGFGAARALLQLPAWSDGTANRLISPVHYAEGRRIRRVCCMRYLVPDGRLCAICPLDANHSARRREDESPSVRLGERPRGAEASSRAKTPGQH